MIAQEQYPATAVIPDTYYGVTYHDGHTYSVREVTPGPDAAGVDFVFRASCPQDAYNIVLGRRVRYQVYTDDGIPLVHDNFILSHTN